MNPFRKTLALWMLLWLTACQSLQPAPLPTIPPPVTIDLTPSTEYWRQAIHDCSGEVPGFSAAVDVVQRKNILSDTSAWVLVSGEPPLPQAYSLGSDHLVWIVNQNNPVASLSADQIAGIYTGFLPAWGKVDASLPVDFAARQITPLHYLDGDELETRLGDILSGALVGVNALAAPGPAEVIQTVTRDETALGFIPSRWMTSTVKAVDGPKGPDFALTLSMNTAPDDTAVRFIACLQKK
jgi:hypothetical protein